MSLMESIVMTIHGRKKFFKMWLFFCYCEFIQTKVIFFTLYLSIFTNSEIVSLASSILPYIVLQARVFPTIPPNPEAKRSPVRAMSRCFLIEDGVNTPKTKAGVVSPASVHTEIGRVSLFRLKGKLLLTYLRGRFFCLILITFQVFARQWNKRLVSCDHQD